MKLGVPAEQNVPDFAPVRTIRYRVVQCATHRTLLGVKTQSSKAGGLLDNCIADLYVPSTVQ